MWEVFYDTLDPTEQKVQHKAFNQNSGTDSMELGVAFKYGSIGALGVILSLLGTLGLSWIVWSTRISGQEGKAISTIIIIVVAGVAVSIIFIFLVIGGFIDQELEAQGLGNFED